MMTGAGVSGGPVSLPAAARAQWQLLEQTAPRKAVEPFSRRLQTHLPRSAPRVPQERRAGCNSPHLARVVFVRLTERLREGGKGVREGTREVLRREIHNEY